MGGFEEYALLARLQHLGKGPVAAGSVGVEEIARTAVGGGHGVGNLPVGIGGTTDEVADGLVRVSVEVKYAGKVARVAHIHGIGDSLHRGARTVLACLQVLVEDIVAVVGGNEALDGEPHTVGKESGTEVTEVAAGHTDDQPVGLALTLHLGIGIEVVERLREEAGHIDGVG